jgi:hypothetical protein
VKFKDSIVTRRLSKDLLDRIRRAKWKQEITKQRKLESVKDRTATPLQRERWQSWREIVQTFGGPS